MSKLNGSWRLISSTNHKELLKSLGRNSIELKFLSKTSEIFRINVNPNDTIDIEGIISINSKALRLFKKKGAYYKHNLLSKNQEQDHKNDEKEFGHCKSRTIYDNKNDTFTVKWYINNKKQTGVLTSVHKVENNQLIVLLTHNNQKYDKKKKCTINNETRCSKVFVRID